MNGMNFDGGGGGGSGGSGSGEHPAHLDSFHACSTDVLASSAASMSQLEPSKYIISHSGPMGTSGQHTTAAAYFARTRSKQHGSPLKQLNILHQEQQQHQPGLGPESSSSSPMERKKHLFDFTSILAKCPPPIPPTLLKRMELAADQGGTNTAMGPSSGSLGKVKVIVRVANSGLIDERRGSHFKLDKKKRQVTLFDPSHVGRQGESEERKVNVSAPKMFAFDGLFTDEDSQAELAASALSDTIHSVVNGSDGCLFCFGHASLGKSYTMIGSDESSQTLGIVPTAIAWLFRSIKEKKDKSSTRFSVRVSATEIGGPCEEVKDLLANVSNEGDTSANMPAPSAYLPKAQNGSLPFQNMSELRCPSAEKAGFFLDAALSARRVGGEPQPSGKDSHFVYTLHVYQYSVDKSGTGRKGSAAGGVGNVIGGRSRLHLIDFGGCERMKTSTGGITLSALGHVILGIFNGQRHLPFKESPVTLLLKECLGSLSCQATMLAHISPAPSHYSETLHTTQLASRIHRMRRKKAKSGGGSGGGSGSGSSDEMKKLVKLHSSSSDFTTTTDPSSSEQSCDTVIYVGHNDDEGTDAEHPPVYLPNLNCGDNRGLISKVLRGSTLERGKPSPTSMGSPSGGSGGGGSRCSTLDRKRQKSPLSPLRSPARNSLRPGSLGGTPKRLVLSHVRGGSLPRSNPKGKMPLHGKVAGYRQPPSHPEWWIDSPAHTGLGGRLGQSGSQVLVHNMQRTTTRTSADWSDQLYPDGGTRAMLASSQPIYGYMDDHKKSMIQQWVECQTAQMHEKTREKEIMRVDHKNGDEPEPFAWLKSGHQAVDMDPNCKVLTQFKTAESSEEGSHSSHTEPVNGTTSVDVHAPRHAGSASQKTSSPTSSSPSHRPGKDPPAPPSMSEPSIPPSPAISSTSLGPEEIEARVEELLSLPDSEPPPSEDEPGLVDPVGREMQAKLLDPSSSGEISKKVRRNSMEQNPVGDSQRRRMSQKSADFPQAGGALPFSCHEQGNDLSGPPSSNKATLGERTETTRASTTAKDDPSSPGTSAHQGRCSTTTNGGGAIGIKSISNGQHQRNIPEHIRSLDKLYTECEELVESLKRQSRDSSVQDEALNGPEAPPASDSNEPSPGGGKIQMAKDDSSCSSTSGSEPDPLQKQISSLDGQNLHFVNKRPPGGVVAKNGNVFEEFDIPSAFHNEEFSRNFDQLAKLHDLYASVSSISAKSQSHLEERLQQRQERAKDDYRNGSCFSLGALMLNDPDNANAHGILDSSVASSLCDINSLCSEPVRMFDYNDFFPPPPASLLVDDEDNLVGGCSISLSDLGLFNPGNSLSHTRPGPEAPEPTRLELNGNTADPRSPQAAAVGSTSIPDRSDSPILEGIDHELAKYAKLKDLKQAYTVEAKGKLQKGGTQASGFSEGERGPTTAEQKFIEDTDLVLSPLRHLPDGASNPDLNLKALNNKAESPFLSHSTTSPPRGTLGCSALKSTVLPRRSPGTGQSSSSSDHEQDHCSLSIQGSKGHLDHATSGGSDIWLKRTSPGSSSPTLKIEANVPATRVPSYLARKQLQGTSLQNLDKKDVLPSKASVSSPVKTAKPQKVPKFSRLFSSATKKISRSPLKIGRGGSSASTPTTTSSVPNSEDKNQSEAIRCDKKGRRVVPPSVATHASGHSSARKRENLLEAPSPTKPLTSGTTAGSATTTTSTTGMPSAKVATSKKGSSKNAPGTSSSTKCSQPIKSTHATINRHQTPTHTWAVIPSPYSFPSAPARSRPKGDTSSNDSGIHFDDRVRLRGRGAGKISNRRANQKHCKSSGYESVGLESERDSIESPSLVEKAIVLEASPVPGETLTFRRLNLPPLKLVQYGEEYVKRLDCRARFNQFQKLKAEQEVLKGQLFQAKSRIRSDPKRWSYELHLEESRDQDKTDASFVEAFEQETLILRKRVVACQSHVKLVTCFDVNPPPSSSVYPNGWLNPTTDSATPGGSESDQTRRACWSPTTQRLFNNCCTTECESVHDIILATTLNRNPNGAVTQETELF